MILLKLFLTFLEIGAVSFGGGYGMISMIREQVLSEGWLTEEQFLDVVAMSESSPGPIAVNMATFVGSKQAGIAGALCATLGVILPSFLVILIVTALVRGLLKYKGVQAFLSGVRPAVAALVLSTSLILFFKLLFGITTVSGGVHIDLPSCIVFVILVPIPFFCKKAFGKKIPPILMILISAVLGAAVFSIADHV